MAERPPPLEINPPLVNSANPWATTLDDLRQLYACPSTGAVTTRTSLIQGFDHDPAKHRYIFFDPSSYKTSPDPPHLEPAQDRPALTASVNSLGYSPLPLEAYLGFIQTISDEQPAASGKGFIVSVTGTPADVAASYALLAAAAPRLRFPLAMEINLSCPNIPGRPPPAYSRAALAAYLGHIQRAIAETEADHRRIPVGLKTPPYTHADEYLALMSALEESAAAAADGSSPGGGGGGGCPISFLTATNTLGSCLVFAPSSAPAPPRGGDGDGGDGDAIPEEEEEKEGTHPALLLGGMAGAPLHPLALGNVWTLRRMLDERAATLGHVRVVGVGGVLDAAGYRRMRAAGAYAVGVGTGLGLSGVGVFGEIERGLGGRW